MTDKQYKRKVEAKKVDLVSFLQIKYPSMIEYVRKKKEWRVPGTNIKIKGVSFYDFDTSVGGDNIRFLTDIMKIPFKDAVDQLLESSAGRVCNIDDVRTYRYERPENLGDKDRVYRYLEKRGIKREVMETDVREEFIYMDKSYNIVFYNPIQEFCILRSSYTDWKGIRSASAYGFWQTGDGKTKDVYIFESPIDALSYMTIYGTEGTYIAMGGIKKGTMEQIQNSFSGYHFFLCVDWDEAGDSFARSFPKIDRIRGSKGKDWNDELNN